MQSVPIVEEAWAVIQGLPAWQGFVLVVGASLLVAVVVHAGGDRAIRRLTPAIPGDGDDVVLRTVHPALYLTVVLVGAGAGLSLFDLGTAALETIRLAMLSLVTVVWAFTLVRLGRHISTEARDSRYVDRQVVPIFQNVWSAVVAGVALFLLLAYWNVDVTPLLASAGIIGIVAGLAAQDTIANFFGSLSLYADGTYRVGDFVVLESGESGHVEDISVRSTVVRTRDDVLVTVPNAALNNGAIVNESAPRRKRRITVSVGVAYGSDVEDVESVLLAAAEETEKVLDDPEPRVRFRTFGDSALEFDLKCWIPSPRFKGRVTHDLNTAIYEAFQDGGIGIPFPQRDVQVHFANGERGPAATGRPVERVDGVGGVDGVDSIDTKGS